MKRATSRRLLIACVALCLTSGRGPAPGVPLLALVGDISLARGVKEAHQSDWGQTLSAVSSALEGRMVYGNLESPLTDRSRVTHGIDLRAPPGAVAALTAFTHLGVTNNHALDGGEAGQRQNMQLLLRHRKHPVTLEVSLTQSAGLTVAWLAFLDHPTAPLDSVGAGVRVREAAQAADVVVVAVHWGVEGNAVTARQRDLARQFARSGATVIVGSGPHVLQEAVRLGKTLVLYSLGNFLFDQPQPQAQVGAVVQVDLTRGLAVCAIPTVSRAGRVRRASGEDRRVALARLRLPSCGASVPKVS